MKARSDDHDRIRAILNNRKTEFRGLDYQVVTYFKVAEGRLKFREGDIEDLLIATFAKQPRKLHLLVTRQGH